MTGPDLKPCPFCGRAAKHNGGGGSVFGRMWWTVGCDDCDIYMHDPEVWLPDGLLDPSYPPKTCFAAWNRRATDQAALPEVQALIAANYRKLVAEITGNLSGTRCDACRSCGYYHCVDAFSGCAGMRDYTLDEATTAIAARDEQMRAEGRVAGLREAADIAGLNAWKHAGEDDYSRGMDAGAYHQVRACCDAIRALADKIEGAANG